MVDGQVEFLKKVPAFEGLDEKGLEKLFRLFTRVDYKKGATILEEGEEGDTVYIIEKGEVEISMAITLALPGRSSEDREKVLVRLGPGSMFGEMAFLFEKDKRTATVSALTDTTLLCLRSKDFEKFAIENYKDAYLIIRNIARIISNRLRKTNQDVNKLTTVLSLVLSKLQKF